MEWITTMFIHNQYSGGPVEWITTMFIHNQYSGGPVEWITTMFIHKKHTKLFLVCYFNFVIYNLRANFCNT